MDWFHSVYCITMVVGVYLGGATNYAHLSHFSTPVTSHIGLQLFNYLRSTMVICAYRNGDLESFARIENSEIDQKTINANHHYMPCGRASCVLSGDIVSRFQCYG